MASGRKGSGVQLIQRLWEIDSRKVTIFWHPFIKSPRRLKGMWVNEINTDVRLIGPPIISCSILRMPAFVETQYNMPSGCRDFLFLWSDEVLACGHSVMCSFQRLQVELKFEIPGNTMVLFWEFADLNNSYLWCFMFFNIIFFMKASTRNAPSEYILEKFQRPRVGKWTGLLSIYWAPPRGEKGTLHTEANQRTLFWIMTEELKCGHSVNRC